MNPFTLWPTLVGGFLFAFLLFTAFWVVQRLTRNAGIVDVGWTVGVGVMAIACAVTGPGWIGRRLLVGLLGGLWAFRLAAYIIADRVRRPEEDGRYRRMREYWGDRAQPWFYLFFTAQSLLVVLFALPFLPLVAASAAEIRFWDGAGATLWLLAIAGESLADRQLQRFRRDPANRGKTCRTGLWRYSRHPNYFCEWLHWWAYVLIGIGLPGGWLTLAGPIVMWFFLMKLTGIPYTEQQSLATRGEDYRDYQRTTNRFFPGPPKASPPP